MANDKISGMTAANAGNLVGTTTGIEVSSLFTTVPVTLRSTLALLRTTVFAGGSGYTATDPLVCGAITTSGTLDVTGATTFSSNILQNGGAYPATEHVSANNIRAGLVGNVISFPNASLGVDGLELCNNTYWRSSTGLPAYLTTAIANRIRLYTGGLSFSTAASGTAGDTITFTERFAVAQSDGAATFSSTLTVTGAFGCNAATPQTAYASGGALAAYGAGANGFDSGANASALHAMVVSIRAALVANGIMS